MEAAIQQRKSEVENFPSCTIFSECLSVKSFCSLPYLCFSTKTFLQVEKLIQEMKTANLESLTISPPEESKAFLDGEASSSNQPTISFSY